MCRLTTWVCTPYPTANMSFVLQVVFTPVMHTQVYWTLRIKMGSLKNPGENPDMLVKLYQHTMIDHLDVSKTYQNVTRYIKNYYKYSDFLNLLLDSNTIGTYKYSCCINTNHIHT